MKNSSKISVNQLTEWRNVALEEMMRIVGGDEEPPESRCVFDTLAYS